MTRPAFNDEETPLTRLAAPRGRQPAFLSEAEARAGERLRVDFTRAGLTPGISQSWDFGPRGDGAPQGTGDLSDSALDARRRVSRALDAVGPELSGLLLDVCCFLKGLETVERERSWPVRSAKLMLKTGLSILARHYGQASGTAREGRIRRWGAADYKPTVSAG